MVSHVAADELIQRGARQPRHLRRNAGGLQFRLARLRLLDARHNRLAGGGQLVDSIRPMHDKGPLGSQRRQRAAHQQHLAGRQHADHLRPRAGRVGQRPAEVEDGPKSQRAAQRPHSLHGRVIERRKEEHESGLAQALDGQLRAQIDGHAQRLQHVGRAAARGDGAVAVLGHFGSRGRGHQRRAGGDVEGQRSPAAGADHVHQLARAPRR